MLDWEKDRAEVLSRIAANGADFKIILKTKDETHFLKDWVVHHRRIAGEAGLVIFDNGSTHPEVLDYYKTLGDRILVVHFSNYMNDLHRPFLMPGLYEALRASSRWFTFIDSDEFLYWVSPGGECLSGRGFMVNLLASEEQVIPGLWLDNVAGYRDRLWLSERQNHLDAALRSGKPVMSSGVVWDGMSNHNFHLPAAMWMGCQTGNIVVAHLRRLYPQQRIKANMAKLRSDKVIGADTPVEAVLAMALPGLTSSTRHYVREIQELTRNPFGVPDPEAVLAREHMLIRDGRVHFAHAAEEDSFTEFLMNPGPRIRAVLAGEVVGSARRAPLAKAG